MRKDSEICYIHDWIVNLGGAEFVLREMLKTENGKVYTLLFKEETLRKLGIERKQIVALISNKIPKITNYYH